MAQQGESRFPDHFDHIKREHELYELWEAENVFTPEGASDQSAPAFSMTMPPPNANGELHLGHAYGYTVMDIIGRFQRLQGKRVLLLPGKDHAGIQTQVVFEKKLREQGVDPDTLPRNELIQRCFDFCIDRAQYMRDQERQLGVGADWERELFTLDPDLSDIVYDTFCKLYADGLLYKGQRIVNWSVLSQTSISDVEVEYKEVEGTLTRFCYPFVNAVPTPSANLCAVEFLAELPSRDDARFFVVDAATAAQLRTDKVLALQDGDGESLGLLVRCVEFSKEAELKEFLAKNVDQKAIQSETVPTTANGTVYCAITVAPIDLSRGIVTATTRPETMLGDTGVAVHPEDPRYKHLIGQAVCLPIQDREIPIVGDKRVEIGFGTGVVKVTPAHSFVDYEIGLDHDLPQEQVIGFDGKMTECAGADFVGLTVHAAKELVLEKMTALGLLLDRQTIMHKVPISERGKDVIQPLISEQWFLSVDKDGNSLKQQALQTLEEIEIYPASLKSEFVRWLSELKDWNISRQLWWGHRIPAWYRGEGEQREIYVGTTPPADEGWIQETDTFDTWFSSGQWSFSTLARQGLLDLNAPADSQYFPTSCMQMGRDILFFWACRMLLLTSYRLKSPPWKSIYFTGIVRDEKGDKMSKSRGNGVEPTKMIEKHGTDALRYAMVASSVAGNDTNVGEDKILGYSKFVNKIWNAARLIDLKLQDIERMPSNYVPTYHLDCSKWILNEVSLMQSNYHSLMEGYQIGMAASSIYDFTWHTFCDWFLEVFKVFTQSERADEVQEIAWVAQESFRRVLQMLHPFAPFVTEEIYQHMPRIQTGKYLANTPFEMLDTIPTYSDPEFAAVWSSVTDIRSVKSAIGAGTQKLKVALPQEIPSEQKRIVESLARVTIVLDTEIANELRIRKPIRGGFLILEHPNRDKYLGKMKKDKEKLTKQVEGLTKKLASDFSQKAPEAVVIKEREKLQEYSETLAKLTEELESV